MHGRLRDGFAIKQQVTRLILVKAAQAIEQSGLTGTVGANQSTNLIAGYIKTDRV